LVAALTVLALTRVTSETAHRAGVRALCVLGVLALAERGLTGNAACSAALAALVLCGLSVRIRASYLAFVALLPSVMMACVVTLAFANVSFARRSLERCVTEAEIRRGTLVYVERWGFVDVTHAHPGPFREALAAIERRDPRVRLYVELIDVRGRIHVVERTYSWPESAAAPWALASAMTLDLERAAEQVQASAPWQQGFAISAFAPHDLSSNLFGVLRAAGRLEPRMVERDRHATLLRYRTLEDDERHARVFGYTLRAGASAREQRDFNEIRDAERRLRKSPIHTFLHPVSREADVLPVPVH
jgi:hypothetical protein